MFTDLANEIQRYSKGLKRLKELHEILSYMPKAKTKIAIAIKRFQAKIIILNADFQAEIHETGLKSTDLMDKANGLHFDNGDLTDAIENAALNPMFHKAKYRKRTFETMLIEIEAKTKKLDLTAIYGPKQLGYALGIDFDNVDQSQKETIRIVFYTEKNDSIGLQNALDSRKRRLERQKAKRR